MAQQEELFWVEGREVVLTPDLHVRCDGGNGPLGHPVEFMTLEKGGEVMCKYCGRRYLHTSHPEIATVRAGGERQAA
jgi:uncharacterized Zn-finger protein